MRIVAHDLGDAAENFCALRRRDAAPFAIGEKCYRNGRIDVSLRSLADPAKRAAGARAYNFG